MKEEFCLTPLVDPVLIPRLTVAIEPSHYYSTNARIMCPISKIAG